MKVFPGPTRRATAAGLSPHGRPLSASGPSSRVLHTLGFTGVIVLVDRVDEPYLINGSARHDADDALAMLDNKFLKHPGLGLKLLLPVELSYYIDREDRDFHQRAPARQTKPGSLVGLDRPVALRPGRVAVAGLTHRRTHAPADRSVRAIGRSASPGQRADVARAAPLQIPLSPVRHPYERPHRR